MEYCGWWQWLKCNIDSEILATLFECLFLRVGARDRTIRRINVACMAPKFPSFASASWAFFFGHDALHGIIQPRLPRWWRVIEFLLSWRIFWNARYRRKWKSTNTCISFDEEYFGHKFTAQSKIGDRKGFTAGMFCPKNQISSSANLSRVSSPITGPLMASKFISWRLMSSVSKIWFTTILCMVVNTVAWRWWF